MIDLILLAVLLGMFYAGFKTGNRFKTLTEAWVAVKTKITG